MNNTLYKNKQKIRFQYDPIDKVTETFETGIGQTDKIRFLDLNIEPMNAGSVGSFNSTNLRIHKYEPILNSNFNFDIPDTVVHKTRSDCTFGIKFEIWEFTTLSGIEFDGTERLVCYWYDNQNILFPVKADNATSTGNYLLKIKKEEETDFIHYDADYFTFAYKLVSTWKAFRFWLPPIGTIIDGISPTFSLDGSLLFRFGTDGSIHNLDIANVSGSLLTGGWLPYRNSAFVGSKFWEFGEPLGSWQNPYKNFNTTLDNILNNAIAPWNTYGKIVCVEGTKNNSVIIDNSHADLNTYGINKNLVIMGQLHDKIVLKFRPTVLGGRFFNYENVKILDKITDNYGLFEKTDISSTNFSLKAISHIDDDSFFFLNGIKEITTNIKGDGGNTDYLKLDFYIEGEEGGVTSGFGQQTIIATTLTNGGLVVDQFQENVTGQTTFTKNKQFGFLKIIIDSTNFTANLNDELGYIRIVSDDDVECVVWLKYLGIQEIATYYPTSWFKIYKLSRRNENGSRINAYPTVSSFSSLIEGGHYYFFRIGKDTGGGLPSPFLVNFYNLIFDNDFSIHLKTCFEYHYYYWTFLTNEANYISSHSASKVEVLYCSFNNFKNYIANDDYIIGNKYFKNKYLNCCRIFNSYSHNGSSDINVAGFLRLSKMSLFESNLIIGNGRGWSCLIGVDEWYTQNNDLFYRSMIDKIILNNSFFNNYGSIITGFGNSNQRGVINPNFFVAPFGINNNPNEGDSLGSGANDGGILIQGNISHRSAFTDIYSDKNLYISKNNFNNFIKNAGFGFVDTFPFSKPGQTMIQTEFFRVNENDSPFKILNFDPLFVNEFGENEDDFKLISKQIKGYENSEIESSLINQQISEEIIWQTISNIRQNTITTPIIINPYGNIEKNSIDYGCFNIVEREREQTEYSEFIPETQPNIINDNFLKSNFESRITKNGAKLDLFRNIIRQFDFEFGDQNPTERDIFNYLKVWESQKRSKIFFQNEWYFRPAKICGKKITFYDYYGSDESSLDLSNNTRLLMGSSVGSCIPENSVYKQPIPDFTEIVFEGVSIGDILIETFGTLNTGSPNPPFNWTNTGVFLPGDVGLKLRIRNQIQDVYFTNQDIDITLRNSAVTNYTIGGNPIKIFLPDMKIPMGTSYTSLYFDKNGAPYSSISYSLASKLRNISTARNVIFRDNFIKNYWKGFNARVKFPNGTIGNFRIESNTENELTIVDNNNLLLEGEYYVSIDFFHGRISDVSDFNIGQFIYDNSALSSKWQRNINRTINTNISITEDIDSTSFSDETWE